MNLSKKQRFLLSGVSGLLMIISFPYTGSLFPLVFFAWIPLLFVEYYCSEKKYKSSKVFLHSYLTFLIFNVGTTYWVAFSIGGEVAAVLAFLANSLLMSTAFILFHWTKKRWGNAIGYLGLFVFWLGFEYFHLDWELSWPWLSLGNTFSIVPEVVQWYSITGSMGGTFWVLAVNLIFFLMLKRIYVDKKTWKSQWKQMAIGGALIILPMAFSWMVYVNYAPDKKSKSIEVIATQPNIDSYTEKFTIPFTTQINRFLSQADSLMTDSTAVVLAPETAIYTPPYIPFNEDNYYSNEAYQLIEDKISSWKDDLILLTGASTVKLFDYNTGAAAREIRGSDLFYESYNTSVLFQKNKPLAFVHKSKLVPGVEKVPFAKWIPALEQLSVDNGGTSGTLGIEDSPQILIANEIPFAPVICYESIYGDFVGEQCRKGAEAIFVITNDGWWRNSAGHKQHASFARLRAIETRRYVVRSANTGISCFINERGEVLHDTDYGVTTAIRGEVRLNKSTTFYVKYGNIIGRTGYYFSILFFFLNLGGWGWKLLRKSK